MVLRKYLRGIKVLYQKKPIWKEVPISLRASAYNRGDESCRVRIHTLLASYMNFNHTKSKSTGTAPQKKPPCYEEIDAVVGDKPTTILSHLISSNGTAIFRLMTANQAHLIMRYL